MPRNWTFDRDDVFPSWFANEIQQFLSAAETNLRLSRKSATVVEIIPDPTLGIAAVAIEGRWRFNEATVERIHPGGAKGTYVVWAVAEDTDVDSSPLPHSDHTDYSFELRITSGAEPEGEGIDVVEKIGEIDWSGTAIEAIRQTLNAVPGAMLADDALPEKTGSDLEWTRQPGGGYLLQLKADSVGANELADNSVFSAALQNLVVLTEKLANLAVTEAKLAGEAVSAAKIAALAVTAAKIANEAITEAKLGNLAVSTAKLANLAVTAAKIANEAVGTGQLAALAVTAAKLAANAVEESKIKDGAVTSRKTKLTTDIVEGEGAIQILNGAYKDVTGTSEEITPAVASYIRIWAIFGLSVHNEASGIEAQALGTINLDGVDQSGPKANLSLLTPTANAITSGSVMAIYKLALTAAKHTIKMRAKLNAGTGATVDPSLSFFSYDLTAQ